MAKLLVVEDDFALGENLQAYLQAKGYKVSLAHDGQEAVEQARAQMPDIILLDVKLPKIGGFDVCRILKSEARTKHIKVVMLTGLGTMGDVETAFSAGADDYCIKPYEPERLVRKIEKVLHSDQR